MSEEALFVPPPLRSDLVTQEQVQRSEPFVIVKDPNAKRYFRLRPLSWQVGCLFDGRTDVAALAGWASRELGEDFEASEVAELAHELARLGLLVGGETTSRREKRSWRYLRFPLVDPDRFLQGAEHFFRPLLSRPGLALLAGLVLAALCLHGLFAGRVSAAYALLGQGWNFLWLYPATVLSLTLHELSHGVVARRFGAEVREMGVMLLYLTPAAYTDVSDAYLVHKRSQRVAISLAGVATELGLWSLATIGLVAINPCPCVAVLLVAMMATTGIRSVLFNLNPLLKLDGYYVLVDLLEMPNLRQRARAVLRWRRLRWFGHSPEPPQERRRERRILELYGWLSVLFIVSVVALWLHLLLALC